MQIGQQVKVIRVRDRLPKELITKLKQSSVGTIKDYRILDGKNIGFVVDFESKFSSWFFDDEIIPL